MTAPTDPPSGRALSDEAPFEYVCRLCGWQWRTVDGLWGHLSVHNTDRATYGTLVAAEKERDRLTIEHAECSNLSHAEAQRFVCEAQEQRERAERAEAELTAERSRNAPLRARVKEMQDRADQQAKEHERTFGERLEVGIALWRESCGRFQTRAEQAESERDAAREALAATREALAASQNCVIAADTQTAQYVDRLLRIERIVDRWRLLTSEQMFERIMAVLRGERPDEPTCTMCGRINPPCGWSTVTFGLPGWRCHDCIDRFYEGKGQIPHE